jgi:hypothetical protein
VNVFDFLMAEDCLRLGTTCHVVERRKNRLPGSNGNPDISRNMRIAPPMLETVPHEAPPFRQHPDGRQRARATVLSIGLRPRRSNRPYGHRLDVGSRPRGSLLNGDLDVFFHAD